MPFSLGLPLIDDNVRKSNLPLYFGAQLWEIFRALFSAGMFCIRIMGPMLGFWTGSYFNKRYYNGEAPHGISPRDPMWIGRWWGGFLLIGGVLFLPSLLLFCFRNPKHPPGGNDEDDKEGDEKRPRSLALVDRHLEKGQNGEVRGYCTRLTHFLPILRLSCQPVCSPCPETSHRPFQLFLNGLSIVGPWRAASLM